jgi:hypothetical protein
MMKLVAVGAIVLLGTLSSCASRSTAPLGIAGSIAVLPTNNRTADPLLVQGGGLVDRYIRHAGRVSVGDVLQSEARFRLQEKGFDVGDWSAQETALKGRVPDSAQTAAQIARQGGLTGRVLYLEIRRWEPDAPTHTRYVIVAMSASIVDAISGQEIWREDRRAAPVPTPGAINIESAYVVAARKVIADILAPLRPAPFVQPRS